MGGRGVPNAELPAETLEQHTTTTKLEKIKVYNRELLDKVRWIPENAAL